MILLVYLEVIHLYDVPYLVTIFFFDCFFVMLMKFLCLPLWPTDGFPFVTNNALGSVPNTQLLQHENASCLVDSGCKYDRLCDSYFKAGKYKSREVNSF